jgi:hypothetical protein
MSAYDWVTDILIVYTDDKKPSQMGELTEQYFPKVTEKWQSYGYGFDKSIKDGGFDEVKCRNDCIAWAREFGNEFLIQCDSDEFYTPLLGEILDYMIRDNIEKVVSLSCYHFISPSTHMIDQSSIKGIMHDPHVRVWRKTDEAWYHGTHRHRANHTQDCSINHDKGDAVFYEPNLCHIHVHDMIGYKANPTRHRLERFGQDYKVIDPSFMPEHYIKAFVDSLKNEKNINHTKKKIRRPEDQVYIKIIGNYHQDPTEYFSRMCKDPKSKTWNKVKLVDRDEDFAVIINNTDKKIDKSTSIVFQMEPSPVIQDFPSPYNKIHRYREEFAFVHDTKTYRNNIEWHISPAYHQLVNSEIDLNKTKTLSTVMSGKRDLIEHQRRLEFLIHLVDNLEIDVWGKGHLDRWISKHAPSFGREMGSLPFREKDLGLFPYKYTYAAENSIENNYFTEKICDAILSECLCFYHGCPNLHEFLHPESYIPIDVCDHEGSLEVIKSAISNNEWEKRLPYIRESKDKILNELQMLPTLEKVLLDD